ncbi:MAG: alpha-galactosidase [Christensenellales bacterium]|jgi:alpha-galactosidase
MAICYDAANRLFHLTGGNTSYVIGIDEHGQALNLYWGGKLADPDVWYMWEGTPEGASFDRPANRLPMEYPTGAVGDMRIPACRVMGPYGDVVTQFTYQGHDIVAGKPGLEGLPATYTEEDNEAQTLILHLKDELTGVALELNYSIYADSGMIARSAKLTNASDAPVQLIEAASASVDLFGTDYELVHLWGGWSIERSVERVPVMRGVQKIGSRRGASGHEHNPFVAIVKPDTTEFAGDAYGFNLVYSGSFAIQAGANSYEATRVTLGLNPEDFTWRLDPGASFQTPEAVLGYSDQGLNGLSQGYHKLYRTRLCRGKYRDEPRPVLVNNWEATYFGFTEEKLLAIAEKGKQIGIEMFVLDDGWFGHRDSDNSSLGDWVVDKKKLPNGLKSLAEKVHALGMKFGLWFEPEMISPDSDLYRAHPDWCLHVPGRARTEARQQLILDLSRKDVCDYVIDAVCAVLSSAPIDYVKWDMNRNFTEAGSALAEAHEQREVPHRYMLGLYRVMESITTAFPDVLFESCSGGGGRFDPGMLYYMPQTWTSDDTDAVERLKIQYGTSMAYPISAMGAHVSAVPNHQIGRTTSMQMRGDVALGGNYGYELDLSKLSQEDLDVAKENIALYKAIRTVVQQGTFTRLISPFEQPAAAWQFVDDEKREAVACYFRVLARPNPDMVRLQLKGLCPERRYQDLATGKIYAGSTLMNMGLRMPIRMKDFSSYVVHLKAVD